MSEMDEGEAEDNIVCNGDEWFCMGCGWTFPKALCLRAFGAARPFCPECPDDDEDDDHE